MAHERNKRRVKRIKEEISIVQILFDYGYHVRPEGGDREQQFPCDLHGDGLDDTPSARVYPESSSWYCFGCQVTRDAIQTIREKEGIGFGEALSFLESRYNLSPMPWEPSDQRAPPGPSEEVQGLLRRMPTFKDAQEVLRRRLEEITNDRDLPMKTILAFWEASDRLVYYVDKGVLAEERGREAVAELLDRIRDASSEERGARG